MQTDSTLMLGAADFPPALQNLFASLLVSDVAWTLMRTPAVPSAPAGDVDILFAPEDLATLRRAARALGFLPLPTSDSPPNLTLMRYDAGGRWLVVDAVTAVTFRRPPAWRPPAEEARGVLA